MNSPMMESNLKGNKELCVCYFIQKDKDLTKGTEKGVEDIAEGRTDVTDFKQPAIDATAKDVKISLDDNLEMTRTEGQTTVKVGKLSQGKQTAKKIQEINSKHKKALKDSKDNQSR